MANKDTLYNVFCENCSQVWQPNVHSALWWKAHKRAEQGYLDAHCASAIECGCKEERPNPNAPFRVFGFNDMCEDFDIPLRSFTGAVKVFKDLRQSAGAIFIDGVSQKVADRLQYNW